LTSNFLIAQIKNKDEDSRLKIGYWLKEHDLVEDGDLLNRADSILQRLLNVADKPLGVLPQLYVFKGLKLNQVFALPDGSIVLPLKTIDFCLSELNSAAMLAFILGHELKHILKQDYWLINSLITFNLDDIEFSEIVEIIKTKQILRQRKALEKEADEYGILYASLAGFEVNSILSPANNLISKYVRNTGLTINPNIINFSPEVRTKLLLNKFSEVAEFLDLFEFGKLLYAIDRYDAAIVLFEKFKQKYPSKEVYNNLGVCYYQKAWGILNKLKGADIDTDPNFAFRLSTSADAFSGLKLKGPSPSGQDLSDFHRSIDKAISLFEKAKSMAYFYETTLNNLGCAYLLKGAVDFAKGCFKEARELNRFNKQAYNNLGVALIAEDDLKDENASEAITNFFAALNIDDRYAAAIYNLGVLHLQRQEISAARKYFERFLELDKTSIYADMARLKISKVHNMTPPQKIKQETIHGKPVLDVDKTNSKVWKSYLASGSTVYVHHDTQNHLTFYKYSDNRLSQKITVVQAKSPNAEFLARGIRIGDPTSLIEERYPFSHTIRRTTISEYWNYGNPRLVFEIQKDKVIGWCLYDIDETK